MIWIIVWAGLLIVVLYSPIGSPDLYNSRNYYVQNQSITVNNNVIQNAPKINPVSQNSDNGLDIPDISPVSRTNYAVNNYQSSGSSSQGYSYSIQNQSYQNNNSSGSDGISSGGNSFIMSGGSRNSSASSAVVMTNGITTLSLTTDLNSNPTKQSSSPYKGGTGGTDPGGDPTGPPIPVGDGWGLLVFFGVCYAAFKKRLFVKNKFLTDTTES